MCWKTYTFTYLWIEGTCLRLVTLLNYPVIELRSFDLRTAPISYVNMLEENEVNIGTEPLDDFDADNNVGESEMLGGGGWGGGEWW
jgi:hypothetical protein